MESRWLCAAVLLLALVGFGACVIPSPCPTQASACFYSGNLSRVAFDKTGPQKYAIGGIFDIRTKGDNAFSCGSGLNPTGILLSHAFLWSVQYWRQREPSSNVAIGGVVFDSCGRTDQMIQNILGFEQCTIRIPDIDRNHLVGFVGPTSNMDAMAAASLTSDMDLTLISPSADSTMLSNNKYTYFLRTTPSIQVDVDVMGAVLAEARTKYVAAIYLQSEMDTFGLFQEKMKMQNICISFSYSMMGDESDDTIRNFVDEELRELEPTRFIALLVSPEFAEAFFKGINAVDEVRSMNLVFLTPSDIRKSSSLFAGQYAVAAADAIVMEQEVPGTQNDIAAAVTAFQTYWNGLTAQSAAQNGISDPFLTQHLNSGQSLPQFDVDAASTILATKAIIEGVGRAGRELCGNSDNYLCTSFFSQDSRGSEIYQKIRTISGLFTPAGSNGRYQNGDLRPDQISYRLYRYKEDGTWDNIGRYVNGAFNRESNQALSTLAPYYPGQCHDSPCLQCGEMPTTTTTTTVATTTNEPICKLPSGLNFSIVYYPPGQEITGAYMKTPRDDSYYATRFEIGRKWIIALGVLAGLGILAVIVFEIYILYKMLGTQMGQKWRTMWLGQLLLFGIFLCYLTLFAYLPIPTKATCGITRFGVGVSYSVCFAVLLVKLMVILTSKSTENSLIPGDVESPNYLKGIYQFLMFVFVVGVQVVIDTQWLITVPPDAVRVTTNNGDDAWICNHYTFRASASQDMTTSDMMMNMMDMSQFVRNEFENHILSLVYIMFLILITTLLALNAHGIITNHRESVFIGIAAGFSIPIWLAWTLVGGLNRDHAYAHEFGDACIAFGLFLTATLILFAMFLPKVRQLVNMGVEGIYYEDDRDTYYAGSVIMAPPSYKSRPNSVIYVNNQGIYSEPVALGNGDTSSNYLRHPGTANPAGSTYSAPPTYLKKGGDGTIRGGSVLRVTDDLRGKTPYERKRPMSEVAYGTTGSRPRSTRGTLPRSRSQTNLGAL